MVSYLTISINIFRDGFRKFCYIELFEQNYKCYENDLDSIEIYRR